MRALKKFFVTVLALGIVGTLAVIGAVWALNNFTSGGPLTERCSVDIADLGKQSLATDQADNAALISAIALHRGLPARAATIGIATAMQESKMRNIDYGDRDSLGMFQQRPSQGWGTAEQVQDPRYATEAFYDVLARIEGYDDMAVTVAAQAVQRSAFPDAYAQHEDLARAFASALTGHAPAALNCRLHPADPGEADIAGFASRLSADFPGLEVVPGATAVEIPPSALQTTAQEFGIEYQQMRWAVANWAVAVADAYGVESVRASEQIWSRTTPWSSTSERKQSDENGEDSDGVIVVFAETD